MRSVAQQAERVTQALDARLGEVARAFDGADEKIAGQATRVAQALDTKLGDIVHTFEGVDRRLAERVVTSASELGGHVDGIAAAFSERAREIVTSFEGNDERLAAHAAALSRVSAQIEDSIADAEARLGAGAALAAMGRNRLRASRKMRMADFGSAMAPL